MKEALLMLIGALLTALALWMYSLICEMWREAVLYKVMSRSCIRCKHKDITSRKCAKHGIDVLANMSCTDWSER